MRGVLNCPKNKKEGGCGSNQAAEPLRTASDESPVGPILGGHLAAEDLSLTSKV